MAPYVKFRKSEAKHYTPPPELSAPPNGHLTTPHRCGVLFAKAFSQELGFSIPQSIVEKVTGIKPVTQTRILRSRQIRTLHNIPNSGPDPRGRKSAFTTQETTTIADYLQHSQTSLSDKSKPWDEIVENAGVELPQTTHFKPSGKRSINPKAIAKTMREKEDIITAVCEEEKELTTKQAQERLKWVEDNQLRDWKKVAFCDEFHFGIEPQITKKIKRKRGKKNAHRPENVHRKKVTSKDTKAKAREPNHLKLLNVFVVIGYNYKRILTYNAGNSNGKMSSKVYIEQILSALREDMYKEDLTLCQDVDSGHIAGTTLKWAKENNFSLLTLPGVSPDLSILESLASPLKRRFHSTRCASESAGLTRFIKLFKEIDQGMIQGMYNKYNHRLEACKEASGQMTKY